MDRQSFITTSASAVLSLSALFTHGAGDGKTGTAAPAVGEVAKEKVQHVIALQPLLDARTGQALDIKDGKLALATQGPHIEVVHKQNAPCALIANIRTDSTGRVKYDRSEFTYKNQTTGSTILTSLFVYPDEKGMFLLPAGTQILDGNNKVQKTFAEGEAAFRVPDGTECIHITPDFGFLPQGFVALDFDLLLPVDGKITLTPGWVVQYDSNTPNMTPLLKKIIEDSKGNKNTLDVMNTMSLLQHISNPPNAVPSGHGLPTAVVTGFLADIKPYVLAHHEKKNAAAKNKQPAQTPSAPAPQDP